MTACHGGIVLPRRCPLQCCASPKLVLPQIGFDYFSNVSWIVLHVGSPFCSSNAQFDISRIGWLASPAIIPGCKESSLQKNRIDAEMCTPPKVSCKMVRLIIIGPV